MSCIDNTSHAFLTHADYSAIAKASVNTAQMTQLIHFMVNSYGVPCYPIFRDIHISSSGFKVYNLKVEYPVRDDWDNVATVHPHKGFLEVFTFKDSQAQKSYYINTSNRECKYDDKIVPLENLLEEIKIVYKLRSKEINTNL